MNVVGLRTHRNMLFHQSHLTVDYIHRLHNGCNGSTSVLCELALERQRCLEASEHRRVKPGAGGQSSRRRAITRGTTRLGNGRSTGSLSTEPFELPYLDGRLLCLVQRCTVFRVGGPHKGNV